MNDPDHDLSGVPTRSTPLESGMLVRLRAPCTLPHDPAPYYFGVIAELLPPRSPGRDMVLVYPCRLLNQNVAPNESFSMPLELSAEAVAPCDIGRRRHPRFAASCKVTLEQRPNGGVLQVVDISRGGLSLLARAPLQIGDAMRLILQSANSGSALRMDAVVRSVSTARDGQARIGCEFARLLSQEELRAYLF